nr:ABC transporter ATP-binding protein [Actinopolymorpha pittospori]
MAAYCWRFRRAVILGVMCSVGASAVAALTPLIVREVVDQVVVGQRQPLAPWLALLVGAGVLRLVFSLVRRIQANRLAYGVEYSLRTDLFASLQRLDGAQQDRLRTGQVVSRAISDVTMIERLLENTPLLASSVVLFVMSLGIMVVLSPLLTVVALVMVPALTLVARRGSKVLFPSFWDYSQRAGEVAGVVEAAVTGVRVVKGFGQEHREQEKLEGALRTLFAAGLRRTRLASRFFPTFNAIPALGQVGVLALGGWLALRGDITLGTFLAFATYLASMIGPVMMFVRNFALWQTAKAALVRVYEIIDSRPSITDAPDAVDVPADAALVELDQVTFGYDADHPVLRDVSLRIEPGETLALVGGAGSGKSTVALLLARFYDPQAGQVRVGGRDIRDFRTSSLRSRMGMVFEESFLFSDTVGSNIAFGRPDARDDDVVAAARGAEADAFIRALPEGYDTVVGERGLTLSGGQRQRIALARALLTDPSVLVLDDATSAVDAGVEAEIHATLRRVMRGRTTLLIAHRRSTLRLADRIAVLHRGELVDCGTHEELVARCPRYRMLLSGHDSELDGERAGELDGVRDGADEAAPTDRAGLWDNPPEAEGTGVFGGSGLPAEQAAGIANLPPATDVPRIDVADARRPEPGFSLGRLIRPFRAGLSLVLVLLILDAVAQLVIPWLTRAGIDHGVNAGQTGALFGLSAIALLVVLAAWLVRGFEQFAVGRTGENMIFWLRTKMYAHLQRLGLDYYERERGGHVMTRMTSDVDAVTSFVQSGLGQAVVAVLSFFGVLGVMLTLDAGLTAGVLTMVPAFVVAALLYRKYASRAYSAAREQLSEVNANFQENVAGIRVAQAYGRERRNIEVFGKLSLTYRSTQMRAQVLMSVFFSFVDLANELAVAIVLGIGAGRVAGGSLTAGGIVAFMLYLTMLFSPLQQMSQVFDGYQRAKVGLRRIGELLQTPTSTAQSDDPRAVSSLSGEIRFDDVRFGYVAGEEEALRGVDLRIVPGETLAVVGETGAGKSTLMKLVARFYDPTSGVVRADGDDLRSLDLTAYRHRLGVVPQEAYLFSGNVRDAIAYGRPEASDADVERAARAVGAHDMIATLRHGYLHPVGERGHGLSAGQRQLLALARAEMVDPDILLLDEATAALDLATEAAVTQATERLAQRRTTLVIAHRLTTAARADRILVVDAGRIVETGAHEDLVRAGGRYAQLWETFTGAGDEPPESRPREPAALA